MSTDSALRIRVRCLDDFDLQAETSEVAAFNEHW